MTRDFMLATLAAFGLTGCGPDLSTDTTDTRAPASVGAAPAPPVAAAQPGGGDPTVAQAEKPDRSALEDPKEERKEDGQKPPQ